MEVWWLALDEVPAALATAASAVLTPEERARAARFVDAHDRAERLLSRVLLRHVLSEYAHIAPVDWRFETGTSGRPAVANRFPPLSFNLSHSSGLVVCAIAPTGSAIGVDVEPFARANEVLSIASKAKVFSSRERAELDLLPRPEREAQALRLWTMKEASMKTGARPAKPVFFFETFRFYAVTVCATGDERRCVWRAALPLLLNGATTGATPSAS